MNPPASIIIDRLSPLRAVVSVPGSKSETNRSLICAALAEGESILRNPSFSEDTARLLECLDMLGFGVEFNSTKREVRCPGQDGRFRLHSAALFCGNAGTTFRFLTALCALGEGEYLINGDDRMQKRPIQELLDALTCLGVRATSLRGNGCPPVRVVARGLEGGDAIVSGTPSSQFLSALMLVAPYARRSVNLKVEGGLVSRPYVDLTERVMSTFGVSVVRAGYVHFSVRANQRYRGCTYTVEPDVSSAGYFWAIAAVTGGCIKVTGIAPTCTQADMALLDRLREMGCRVTAADDGIEVEGGPLKGIDADMTDCPDAAPTLSAVALFARGTTTLRGVANLRHKESDRLAAIEAEWTRLGARIEVEEDLLRIHPGPLHPATVSTYQDHRIAMSAAVVGTGTGGLTIENPGCVSKSFPHFFDVLSRLRNA